MPDIRFEIEKHIAVLSDHRNDWKKEINLVAWGSRDAKYDIREWNADHSKCHKGVTLTSAELKRLKDVLNSLDI